MSGSFGELVLVAGDFHIPHRAGGIHEKFRKILVPNKMQHVLCTGNLVSKEHADFLRSLAAHVHIVRGDFDDDDSLPDTKVVTIQGFKIGLCHGHYIVPSGEAEALAILQRQLDVDVLVTGCTHRNSVVEFEGKCYVNPGSITGAYTPGSHAGELTPSFTLMSIQDGKIEFFLYELVGGELKISRSMFQKGGGGITRSA